MDMPQNDHVTKFFHASRLVRTEKTFLKDRADN